MGDGFLTRVARGEVEFNERPNYNKEVIEVNFKVVSKKTGITYDVYAVREGTFLIYYNNNFTWQSMSLFRPTKKTEQEMLQSEIEDSKTLFRSQREKKTYSYP